MPVGLHGHDPGDLGDRVGIVGRLERPGEERGLGDRLRRQFRVDARRPEEQQPVDIGGVRGLKQVGLDAQVVVEEVHRGGRVGHDPADLRGGHDHYRGLRGEDRVEGGISIAQVDLSRAPADQIGEPLRLQVAPHRGADESVVPGHVDA